MSHLNIDLKINKSGTILQYVYNRLTIKQHHMSHIIFVLFVTFTMTDHTFYITNVIMYADIRV